MEDRVLVSVEDLLTHVCEVSARYGIEGVTLLGGEPFAQAAALARFAKRIHDLGLSVVTYTGYRVERLLHKPEEGWGDLLAETDILVEGPFWANEFSANLLWRGSRNQRIVFLSDRHTSQELSERCITWMEVSGLETSEKRDNGCEAGTYHLQLPPPELQVFDDYYEQTELHWSYLKPLEIWNENGDQTENAAALSDIGTVWWPEFERSTGSLRFIRKGLIVVVGQEHTHLYGFQGGDDLDRFQSALEPLGIRLEPSTGGHPVAWTL